MEEKKRLRIKVLPPILNAIIYSGEVENKFDVIPRQETSEEDEDEAIIRQYEQLNNVKEIPDDYFPGY